MIDEMLSPKEDEAVIDYIARMVDLKDELGITWTKLAEIINDACGVNYSESFYRKGNWQSRFAPKVTSDNVDFLAINDEVNTAEPVESGNATNLSPEEAKLRNLLQKVRKEKVKLSDERIQNNAYIRRLSREETIKDIAHDFAVQMEKKPLLVGGGIIPYGSNAREAILTIGDWHYGIDCNSYWNTYNPEIARQRVSKLRDEVRMKCLQESIKTLHVVNLSDLICGRIHLALRLESRIDVITQVMEVSEILAEFLSSLSDVTTIEYYDCEDNHSRLEPNKSDSINLESFVRIIHWYLKERLSHNERIHINDNTYGEDIIAFSSMGYRIIGVHGNKDKPKDVVDRLAMMTKERPDLVLVAHYHHFSADELNEVIVLGNGSLMGTDTYAKDMRLTAKPSQNMVIVSDRSVVDTLYRIVL